MIIWITRELALAIHERQVAEHGGDAGIRDEAMLESALARPRQLHAYGDPPPDLAALAASLAFGLARNHPFVDGNKRTAHVCYRAFLALHDTELTASGEEMYLRMLALAEGSLPEADFADWLRPRLRLATADAVHEPQGAARQPRGDAATPASPSDPSRSRPRGGRRDRPGRDRT